MRVEIVSGALGSVKRKTTDLFQGLRGRGPRGSEGILAFARKSGVGGAGGASNQRSEIAFGGEAEWRRKGLLEMVSTG